MFIEVTTRKSDHWPSHRLLINVDNIIGVRPDNQDKGSKATLQISQEHRGYYLLAIGETYEHIKNLLYSHTIRVMP